MYSDRYKNGGTKSFKTMIESNGLNKKYKKNLLDNHFELGGKTLISPNPNGPIRLLESEKRMTYFKSKELSKDAKNLSEKFKGKIERQNWNIK